MTIADAYYARLRQQLTTYDGLDQFIRQRARGARVLRRMRVSRRRVPNQHELSEVHAEAEHIAFTLNRAAIPESVSALAVTLWYFAHGVDSAPSGQSS